MDAEAHRTSHRGDTGSLDLDITAGMLADTAETLAEAAVTDTFLSVLSRVRFPETQARINDIPGRALFPLISILPIDFLAASATRMHAVLSGLVLGDW